MFKKPTIFTDDSGSHVLGIDGSVKASFTVADHGASHEGAAISHLQQNFDDYMGEEAEQIDEISDATKAAYKSAAKASMQKAKNAQMLSIDKANHALEKVKPKLQAKHGITDDGNYSDDKWNAYQRDKEKSIKKHLDAADAANKTAVKRIAGLKMVNKEEVEQTDEAVYNGHRPTGPLQGRGGLDKHHQAALDAKLKEIDAKFAKPKPIAEGQKPYVSTRQGHAVVLGSDGQELKKFTKAQHGASYMTKANAYLDQHYGSLSKQNEEVEQISESLFGTTTHGDQDSAKSKVKDMHTKLMKSGYRPKYGAVDHSKLRLDGYGTKYSKPGSGHEIHVSAHRDRAGEQIRVSVDKKKVNEETEQIDELSKKTLGSYQTKAIAGPMDDTVDTKRVSRSKRAAGIRLAGKKMYPEIAKHNGGKAKVAATEETLVDLLSGLKESHIRTMVEVYESLNEENQAKFVATCKKDGGIDAMLNFAIKNRGE